MRWYINELSIQGQFISKEVFRIALHDLLRLRRLRCLKNSLFCSREIFRARIVYGNVSVADAIRSFVDRDFKVVALQWLDKFGPFLEDDRTNQVDDYFEFEGYDVTNMGLGEAARREIAGNRAGTFSFRGGVVNFERSELSVQHGLIEEPLAMVGVENVWQADALRNSAIKARGKGDSWSEMLERFADRYDCLLFSAAIEAQLSIVPFSGAVRDSLYDLLDVLDEIMKYKGDDGSINGKGIEIFQRYFVGTNAWFSDESKRNKRDFLNEMTFKDIGNAGRKLTCFWHGKVQAQQIRVHFEWPVPVGQRRLKVLYIGPKISKR